MDHQYVIPFEKLPAARATLQRGLDFASDDLEAFAFSMLSASDAAILRHIVSNPDDGDRAGWAALALYSMGGVGDLSTEIKPWLFVDDNGDRIHTAGPVVLASCVTDLYDATACRVLIEFSEKYTVKLELEPLLKQLGEDGALVSVLTKSRAAQIEATLSSSRLSQNRRDWLLRTYVDDYRVRKALAESVRDGSLYALASLFFVDDAASWALFEAVAACAVGGPSTLQLFANLAQENLARGASRLELSKTRFAREPAVRAALSRVI